MTARGDLACAPRLSRQRRGINLVGLLLLVMVIAAIGMALSMMARQSKRSSHWFLESQAAFDLAQTALVDTYAQLREQNGLTKVALASQAGKISPKLAQALTGFYDAITKGITQSATLVDDSNPTSLPESVKRILAGSLSKFSPHVKVTLALLKSEPLWTDLLEGIPADPLERLGTVRITSVGTVVNHAGLEVTRSLVIEKDFKLVSVLPAVLGRFTLFALDPPERDPNFVTMHINEKTGQGVLDAAGPQPLVVRGATAFSLASSGQAILDRSQMAQGGGQPALLDEQGWIYLGQGQGSGQWQWTLRIAHGWGPGGESPLVPGYWVPCPFRGSASGTQQFLSNFANGLAAVGYCRCLCNGVDDGLFWLFHGFADNYDCVGLCPEAVAAVRASTPNKMDLGPGATSALRLFGSPDQFSPTLVFGPVQESIVRKTEVHLSLDPAVSTCHVGSRYVFNLFNRGTHPPALQGVLDGAFGDASTYDAYGPAHVELPYVLSLGEIFHPGLKGHFSANGVLDRDPDLPVTATWNSTLFQALGPLPTPTPTPIRQAAIAELWQGKLDTKFYKGDLGNALVAFTAALTKRLTFAAKMKAMETILSGRTIKVPGVVFVDAPSPLVLTAIDTIAEGGVLIARDTIRIDGNIQANAGAPGAAGGEPLTLVSLNGNIELGPGAHRVEAYLVAANGRVTFPPGRVDLVGGVACRTLDLQTLARSPAERTLTHNRAFDPANDAARDASLRLYYSGDERLAAMGAGGN